jgi:hypothetical protein
MTDFYSLPKKLEVGGRSYNIRTDYRVILDILASYSDPELDGADKTQVLVEILYIDYESIPLEHMEEAIKKACWFIDTGIPANNKPQPRTMDWVKDSPIIIPEVNKYIGKEVRSVKYMHWWTFFGAYMQIGGEGLYSSILNYRQKKAKGKKMEQWELDFGRENRELCELDRGRKQEEVEAIQKLFG